MEPDLALERLEELAEHELRQTHVCHEVVAGLIDLHEHLDEGEISQYANQHERFFSGKDRLLALSQGDRQADAGDEDYQLNSLLEHDRYAVAAVEVVAQFPSLQPKYDN